MFARLRTMIYSGVQKNGVRGCAVWVAARDSSLSKFFGTTEYIPAFNYRLHKTGGWQSHQDIPFGAGRARASESRRTKQLSLRSVLD